MNAAKQLDQNFFRQLVEASADAMVVTDQAGAILFQNNQAEMLFRSSSLDDASRASLQKLKERAVQRESGSLVLQVAGRDGNPRWLETHATPVRDDAGRCTAVLAVTRDITSRHQTANNLQRSQALLSATLEATADGLLVVDTGGKIVSFNRRFAELWRIPADIVESGEDARALAFVLEQLQDPESFLQKVRDLYSHPEAASYDILHFKDGRIFERYSRPRQLDGRTVGRVWCFRDVTERKRNEAATRASEARFRAIVNSSPELVKLMDAECRLVDINPAGLRIIEADSLAQVQGANTASLVVPEYRDAYRAGVAEVFRGNAIQQQFEIVGLRGTRRWVELQAVPLWDEQSPGKVKQMLAVTRDLTWRKQTEQKLEMMQFSVEHASDAIFWVAPDAKILYANEAAWRRFGDSREDVLKMSVFDFDPDFPAAEWPAHWVELKQRGSMVFESRHRTKDGRIIHVEINANYVCVGGHEFNFASSRDITERKLSEQKLRERDALLQKLSEQVPGVIYQFQQFPDGRSCFPYASEGIRGIYEVTPEQVRHSAEAVFRVLHPDDLELIVASIRQSAETLSPWRCLYRVDLPARGVRWLEGDSVPERLSDGSTLWHGYIRDVTERKQAEDALHSSEHRLRTIFDTEPECVKLLSSEGLLLEMNPAGLRMIEADSFAQVANHCVYPLVVESDRPAFRELTEKVFRGESGMMEFQIVGLKGSHRWLESHASPLRDTTGTIIAVLAITRDITARKAAEEDRQRTLDTLQLFIDSVPAYVSFVDASQRYQLVNGRYEEWFGRKRAAIIGRKLTDLHPAATYEDMRPFVEQALAGQAVRYERCITGLDQQKHWFDIRYIPRAAKDGSVAGFFALVFEITERKQAEEALRESENRLRQSQKLEAIGRLAGGVAHDFNNLLTTMMLHADLAGIPDYLPGETLEGLAAIRGAARRAADLTRQLLLFGRRQVMQPRYVNLNDAVSNLVKLLDRTLGDDVRTRINLSSSPTIVHVDAGMLDQVLMNLAVNARDAMPNGGNLIIETTDVTLTEEDAAGIPEALAGHYVCLTVTDTGCGISPENLSRIFEPFFTTKEPGKGTGLGLATVFGIVKQHDGFIRVHSTVGKGTTFRIFLPAKGSPADAAVAEVIRQKPGGGSELILVVEDDRSVRKVTCRLLEQQGYRILEAANGVEALRIWEERKQPIHLLFTDLTMPEGVSGLELSNQLRKSDPRLKVLFTSGHSAEFAGREMDLQEGQNFLQKPSTSHQLLQTVRRCLDE